MATTTLVPLDPSIFVDLGAGPLEVGAGSGALIYDFSDTQPSDQSPGLGTLAPGQSRPMLTASHVWARGTGSAAVAASSAATGAGGGGGGGSAAPPVGAANIFTGQWSNATAGATQIAAARTGAPGTGRVSITLYNAGSTTFFYGAAGVTTATGSRLLPNGSRTLYTTAAIFGIPQSGTANADYDEVY